MRTSCGNGSPRSPPSSTGETTWTVTDTRVLKRAVLLVSEEAHCLHDMLGRVAVGELPVRLAAVIGNHDRLAAIVERARRAVPPRRVPTPGW